MVASIIAQLVACSLLNPLTWIGRVRFPARAVFVCPWKRHFTTIFLTSPMCKRGTQATDSERSCQNVSVDRAPATTCMLLKKLSWCLNGGMIQSAGGIIDWIVKRFELSYGRESAI